MLWLALASWELLAQLKFTSVCDDDQSRQPNETASFAPFQNAPSTPISATAPHPMAGGDLEGGFMPPCGGM